MTSTAPSTKRLESSTPSETAIRWPTTELLLRQIARHLLGERTHRLRAGVQPPPLPRGEAVPPFAGHRLQLRLNALKRMAGGAQPEPNQIRAGVRQRGC